MANHNDMTNILLDEYRIEELLGQGGMARVYRGFDTRLHRYVAIKVIDRPFRNDQDYIKRFEREAQSIARLDHPHIVKIFRFGEAEDLVYMAMQYVEGSDLGAVLDSYQTDNDYMEPEDILRITRELCMALDYSHSAGVIHRDVKPSNVMLNKEGKVILTDFGLALQAQIGTAGEIFGSPHYLSPEQAISSANVSAQSDLYSVGVMLFEMFTNQLPFDASEPMAVAKMHMADDPPSPRQIRPEISETIAQLILKSLAKEPDERYQSGAELSAALATALTKQSALSTQSRHSMMDRVEGQMAAYPLPPLPPAATRPAETQVRPPTPTLAHQPEPTPTVPRLETDEHWTDNRPNLSQATGQPRWFYGVIIGGVVLVGLALLIGFIYAFSGNDDDKKDNTVAQITASVTATTVLNPTPTQIVINTQVPPDLSGNVSTPTPLILPTTAIPQPTLASTLTQVPPPTNIPATSTATSIPPTAVPVTVATTPASIPASGEDFSYTLVIMRNMSEPGHESLLIANNEASTHALNLADIRLGEGQSAVAGSYWNSLTNILAQNSCLSLYHNPNDPNLPPLICDQSFDMSYVTSNNSDSFWTASFKVFYQNHEVATCFPDDGAVCQVRFSASDLINEESQNTRARLQIIRLEKNHGIIVYNPTNEDIIVSALEIWDDKAKVVDDGTDWGIDVLPAKQCVRLWKDNEVNKGNNTEEKLTSVENEALTDAEVSCVMVGERAEFKNKAQFWTKDFTINWNGQTAECTKNDDVCEMIFEN